MRSSNICLLRSYGPLKTQRSLKTSQIFEFSFPDLLASFVWLFVLPIRCPRHLGPHEKTKEREEDAKKSVERE